MVDFVKLVSSGPTLGYELTSVAPRNNAAHRGVGRDLAAVARRPGSADPESWFTTFSSARSGPLASWD